VARNEISVARLAVSTSANAVFNDPLKIPSASRYEAFVSSDASLSAV